MSLSKELEKRGFVNQFTGESLSEILDGEKRVVYHGIDPNADSAHAGNFVNWMLLSHLVKAGHKVIFLVGGGTGMIGDPKPDIERTLTDIDTVEKNVQKLKAQAEHLLGGQEIQFVNNYDWLGKLDLISFLRDVGKHFSVNELIKKDAIATRLSGENGLSYTEFAYPLLQAFDYLTLNQKYSCDVQVGGSDQWGNIVSGVDLIRRVEGKTVHAVTVPLIIDKTSGKKFGKSEGNAVWIDAEKTSPYEFYQFWLNTTDNNIIDYLKLFTFLSLEEIEEINKAFDLNPGSREAQKTLAFEITSIVHSAEVAALVQDVSGILFGEGSIKELTESGRKMLVANAPIADVVLGSPLIEVLVESGLATSKREARTFIESGAISINDEKVSEIDFALLPEYFLNNLALLRRGKKQLRILSL